MLLITLSFILITSFQVSLQQNASPCPSIFTYEPRGSEPNRWYGRVTLSTAEDLYGIWIHVELDNDAELIGNWFGEVSTTDNRKFLIKNTNYEFRPNHQPLSVRFFVQYKSGEYNIPSLYGLRLNGREICRPILSQIDFQATTKLFLSESSTPSTTTVVNSVQDRFLQVDERNRNRETEEFLGDFSPRRPIVTVRSTTTTTPRSISKECGIVTQKPLPLITNGQNTKEGQWPWHIAVYHHKGIDLRYLCGGTLISTQHVLTTAHCVKFGSPARPELFIVYLGKHNLYEAGVNVKSLQVSNIVTHPSYNVTYYRNDISILKLESAIEITDFIRPICLWDEDIGLGAILNRLGTVVGWGYDHNGKFSETLQEAKMPIVTSETCLRSQPEFYQHYVTDHTYCAGFRNGTTTCTGDSGGGMFFMKSSLNNRQTVWQLRGIVSISPKSDNEVCDRSNYVVFSDVAKHLDWIKNTIRKL